MLIVDKIKSLLSSINLSFPLVPRQWNEGTDALVKCGVSGLLLLQGSIATVVIRHL